MNRIFAGALAGIFVLAGADGAAAADMGHKARKSQAVDAAPVAARDSGDVNWSGLYLGINGGFGEGQELKTYTSNAREVNSNFQGGLAGFDLGIRRQLGHAVVGLEGDATFANLPGSHPCPNAAFDCQSKIDGLESFRGVLGMAAGRWLAYGTAGIGFEQTSANAIDAVGGYDDQTKRTTKTGWVAGAGLETMLTPQLSLAGQYLHYGFGTDNRDEVSATSGAAVANANFRESADIFTARLNFKLVGPESHVPLK